MAEVKVYGDYFDEKMRARAQRDGIAGLQRAVVRQAHYAVRCYVTPAQTPDTYWYFRLRRDGRVEKSWGPVPATDVLERGESLELNPYWAWIKSTSAE